MNKLKDKQKASRKRSKGPVIKFDRLLNLLEMVQQEFIRRVMPFLFFVFVLCLFYIANIYHAEKTIRKIDKAGKEIKELRSAYISGKSEVMYSSNQSEIARSISEKGIKESVIPPKKIVVKEN